MVMGKYNIFSVLRRGGTWFRDEKTCLEWDALLSGALDKYAPVKNSDFTHKVGPFIVWTRNYPYGYGNLDNFGKKLPKRTTAIRLYETIKAQEDAKYEAAFKKDVDRCLNETS